MRRTDDYRGEMTPEKARRLIADMSTEAVVLGITAPYSLTRDHTITAYGPLPASIVLDVLAERIRGRAPGGLIGTAYGRGDYRAGSVIEATTGRA